MSMKTLIEKSYDVVVVGGGMSGLCAAIASARHGAKTALIQNRPVLGGNASSEIRMHICGALNSSRSDSRETGILEEILLENKRRNPQHSFSIFDTILWEKATFQNGLDLYLNTQMTDVLVNDNEINGIYANQLTTEKTFQFNAAIFIDATGDATLSFLAGAETMIGREGKDIYGEKYAPDISDNVTMGNSLMFKAVDTGHPIPFIKPWWANTYTEEDFTDRGHNEFSSGYWWIELGGDELNTIDDAEILRNELLKAVYGVWDHIKNSGNHPAENWDLDWVGFLPGKRESRRVLGDYILKEQDCLDGRIFDDAVAYGGWPMDMHVIGGFRSKDNPTVFLHLKDVYTIPYRSLYSKNIKNLIIGGRAISTSHMAFGSTRVMATCAVIGQAGGTAAALAIEKGISPKEVMTYTKELQQTLLKDDCYIPGFKNEDSSDLAKIAIINCSSSLKGAECENIVNGVARKVNTSNNCWISDELGAEGEWISLSYDNPVNLREVHLAFDSNLSKDIMISLSKSARDNQVPGIPPELIKDYRIEFYKADKLVHTEAVSNNYLRQNVHNLETEINCDMIKINVFTTNGDKHARIFEVRVY